MKTIIKPTLTIPRWLSTDLGVHKSLITRWNYGKRQIGAEHAIQVVEILQQQGFDLDIIDLRPDLRNLAPFLCRAIARREHLKLPIKCPIMAQS